MTNFHDDLSKPLMDALVAGLATGFTLVLEHVALHHEPFRLSRPVAYIVGTGTVGLAFSWWSIRHRAYVPLIVWWVIAGSGGAMVLTAFWLRTVFRRMDEDAFYAGLVAGSHGSSPADHDANAPLRTTDHPSTHYGNKQRPTTGDR